MKNTIILGLITVLSSCASIGNDHDEVKERASFELNCKQSKLRTKAFLHNTSYIGVSGCGKKAVYVYDRASGAWLLNSNLNKKKQK